MSVITSAKIVGAAYSINSYGHVKATEREVLPWYENKTITIQTVP